MKKNFYERLMFPEVVVLINTYFIIQTLFLSWLHQFNLFSTLLLNFFVITLVLYICKPNLIKLISQLRNEIRKHWCISLLLILLFIQGIFSSPNTVDGMVYHLPRVMYWIQNNTTFQSEVYTSHDYMPAFGGFLLAQVYLWIHSDRLLFLPQFFSFIICIVVGRLILKKFIKDETKLNLGTILIATIPMGIMQANTVQNDLVTSGFLLLATYFAINFWKSHTLKDGIFFALACSLGFLTKPTIVFFVLGPVLVFLFAMMKAKNRFKNFTIVVCLSAVFFLTYFIQNAVLYGLSLGSYSTLEGSVSFKNDEFGIGVFVSNLIRNLFLHIPVPFLNNLVYALLDYVHLFLGIGISDPVSTWEHTNFVVNPVLYPHEDVAGNPIHLLLIITAGFFIWKKIKFRELRILYWCTIFGFLLFCFVLKWQPWNSRLHLPWFYEGVLVSIVILLLAKVNLKIIKSVSYISLCLSFVLVLFSVLRTYIPYNLVTNYISVFQSNYVKVPEPFYETSRIESYFNAVPYWEDPYVNVMIQYRSLNSEVLYLRLVDDFEYPIWVLKKELGITGRIEKAHIGKTEQAFPLLTTSAVIPKINAKNTYCKATRPEKAYACLFWN